MKLPAEDLTTLNTQSNDSNNETFKIKTSSKAFQILSSNLYSNPLGAMIRELSTNAYDVHVLAGKENEPFIIKLPVSSDPVFKIRDFGPGLSDNQIKTIYTTFFESTKTNSNDVVGCLGLGSKSPFGVTDNFKIISYYNNTKTIYSAFLNKKRIPTIKKISSQSTNEPNGLEIEVPIKIVKKDDVDNFIKEVNNQLKYFKTKPKIIGNSDFKWNNDEEYILEGSNWKIFKAEYYNRIPKIIQGQIAYPININDMGTSYKNASDAVKELLTKSILFEVPIGSINIAPSREALYYDEITCETIIKEAEKALNELSDAISKEIQKLSTLWEAKVKYSEIMNTLFPYTYNSSAIEEEFLKNKKILWNGQDVSHQDILIKKDYIKNITGYSKDYTGRYRKIIYRTRTDYFKINNENDYSFYWTITATDLNKCAVIYSTPNDKAVEKRAKQFCKDNYDFNTEIIIIETTESYETIKKLLDIPVLLKASELPKIKTNKKTKNKISSIPVQQFRNSYNKSDQWETIYVDDLSNLNGFYVNLDRYDVEYNGDTIDIKNYWLTAQEMNLIPKDVKLYGLKKRNQKRKHNLINFFEHCKKEIQKISQPLTLEYPVDHMVAQKLQSNLNDAENLLKHISNESPAYKFIDLIKQQRTAFGNHWNINNFINLLGINKKEIKKDISKLTTILEERYPMIAEISHFNLDEKKVSQYINQMDMIASLLNKKNVFLEV